MRLRDATTGISHAVVFDCPVKFEEKVHDLLVSMISEVITTSPYLLISAAPKLAGHSVVASHAGDSSVTQALQPAHQPALDARCLWCGQVFKPRATGGSAQKFCCTGHRQEFWIAARRWTMRAIDAVSVDCLKASHTSVHAG